MRTWHRKYGSLRRKGFTLVELLAVVVILGLLITTVAVAVRGQLGRSKQSIARMRAGLIAQAIERYAIDQGRIPSMDEGLEVLILIPEGQSQAYIKPGKLKDPWDYPFEYQVPGRYSEYEILSYGADGQPGGEGEDADISTDDEYEEEL